MQQRINVIIRSIETNFYAFVPELQPYKYAGYPQLIKTIQMETKDEQLFSKKAPLLCAASELAYYTVHCSALNAEELRRENGLEVHFRSHLHFFYQLGILRYYWRLTPDVSVF